ncbi:MAG: hypothetical protein M3P24_08450, partial [Gemmatimonadota bacterium]|nr:hypothetical protein [Gemmatimonadota bacterium]
LHVALAAAPDLPVAAAPSAGFAGRVHTAAHGPDDARRAPVARAGNPVKRERRRRRVRDEALAAESVRQESPLPSLGPVRERLERPALPGLVLAPRESVSGTPPGEGASQPENPRPGLQVTLELDPGPGPTYALSRSAGGVLPQAAPLRGGGIRLRIGRARRSAYGALEGVY